MGKPSVKATKAAVAAACSQTLKSFFQTKKQKQKRGRGRPKKAPAAAKSPPAPAAKAKKASTASAPLKTPSPAAGAPVAVTEDKKVAGKRQLHQWNTEEAFPVLQKAILAAAQDEKESSVEFLSIPRSTFTRMNDRFQAAATQFNVPLAEVTRTMVFKQKGNPPLMSESEVTFFQDILQYRDLKNRSYTRMEAVGLMMEITQNGNRRKCEDHYDYLIRQKRLPLLKRGGRVTSAQGTTTKRTQIHAEQQLRWMGTMRHVKSFIV